MDIVNSINRYISGGVVEKGARTRLVRARDEIVRLRALTQRAPEIQAAPGNSWSMTIEQVLVKGGKK